MPDPAVGEEQVKEASSNFLPDLNMDSREVSGRHGDQAMHQDPGSQEAREPEDQNQHEANEEGYKDLAGLPFPRKLWSIVESDAFQSLCWNEHGDAVVIDVDLFQEEILGQRGPGKIFEADSLKSFIHQLGLYSFRRIRPHDSEAQSWGNRTMMIYYNFNFQRDKPGLLEHIWRKGDLRNPAMRGTCTPVLLRNPAWQGIDAPNPKKKKRVATRYSPRFPREDSRKSQGGGPQDEGPRGPPPTVFSGIWAMKSVAGHTLDNQAPQVPRGPNGEGATGNGTAAPPATATEQGACEEPSSSSAYREHCALMSLYNACYSIVLTAHSAKSPDELPGAEEEEEDTSDLKSVLCEPVKDNPQP